MDEAVHIEFLVEDASGKLILEKLMEKYSEQRKNISFRIKGFKGIGRLPKRFDKISMIKTQSLLHDLPAYLKGLSKSLRHLSVKKAIIVALDCDDKDCKTFHVAKL